MPHDNGDRDWSDAFISREMPKFVGNSKLMKTHGTHYSPAPSERTWTFGLLALRTVIEYISVFSSHLVCCTFSWQPWETNTRRQGDMKQWTEEVTGNRNRPTVFKIKSLFMYFW